MNKEEAKIILKKSINNLFKRQEVVRKQELEKDVIFLITYEILKQRKKDIANSKNMMDIVGGFSNSMNEIIPVSAAFTEAAKEFYPKQYDVLPAMAAMEIQNIIFEDNAWDVLREYFLSKHGYDIDENLIEEGGFHKFSMISKRQIVNNSRIMNENIEVKIAFIETYKIIVTVGAIINKISGNLLSEDDFYNLEYDNNQSDYKFIIHYDNSFRISSFDTINKVDNKKIEYFEV
jgi:hypothetical protein